MGWVRGFLGCMARGNTAFGFGRITRFFGEGRGFFICEGEVIAMALLRWVTDLIPLVSSSVAEHDFGRNLRLKNKALCCSWSNTLYAVMQSNQPPAT